MLRTLPRRTVCYWWLVLTKESTYSKYRISIIQDILINTGSFEFRTFYYVSAVNGNVASVPKNANNISRIRKYQNNNQFSAFLTLAMTRGWQPCIDRLILLNLPILRSRSTSCLREKNKTKTSRVFFTAKMNYAWSSDQSPRVCKAIAVRTGCRSFGTHRYLVQKFEHISYFRLFLAGKWRSSGVCEFVEINGVGKQKWTSFPHRTFLIIALNFF